MESPSTQPLVTPPAYHRHPAVGKITIGGQAIATSPQMLALVQEHVDKQFQQLDVTSAEGPAAVLRRRSRGDSQVGKAGKSNVICRHWMLSRCMFGAACRFSHGTADNEGSTKEKALESPSSECMESPDQDGTPNNTSLVPPEGQRNNSVASDLDPRVPREPQCPVRERNDSLSTTATTPHVAMSPMVTPSGATMPLYPPSRAKAAYLVIQTQPEGPSTVISPQISPRAAAAAGYMSCPATVPPSPQAFALSPTSAMSVRVGQSFVPPLSPMSAAAAGAYYQAQKGLSVRVGVPTPPMQPRPNVVCAPMVLLPACYLTQYSAPAGLSRRPSS